MWIFTESGFVSVVADRRTNELVVRARDRKSLAPLAEMSERAIVVGAGTDYRYRVTCTRPTLQRWLDTAIAEIDYDNFKDRVHDTRGGRFADALMDVWFAMCAVSDHVTESTD